MTAAQTPLTAPSRRALLRSAGIGAAALAAGVGLPALTSRASAAPVEPVPGFVVPISRQEVIDRAMTWVDAPRPYDMRNSSVGPENDESILWRTDCSGFVSMALKVRFPDNPTGLTTQTLHPNGGYDLAREIDVKELAPGDFILQLNEESASGVGHVVLFNGWLDDQGGYDCLEQSGGAGQTVRRRVTFGYDGVPGFHAFRYHHIQD